MELVDMYHRMFVGSRSLCESFLTLRLFGVKQSFDVLLTRVIIWTTYRNTLKKKQQLKYLNKNHVAKVLNTAHLASFWSLKKSSATAKNHRNGLPMRLQHQRPLRQLPETAAMPQTRRLCPPPHRPELHQQNQSNQWWSKRGWRKRNQR